MSTPEPQFVFASGMPLTKRLTWIALLAVAGISIQILISPIGWFAVFVAGLLGAMSGRSNKPDVIRHGGEWQNVTEEELERAEKLTREADEFKSGSGAYSLTNACGCAFALLVLIAGAAVAIFLFSSADGAVDENSLLRPVAKGGPLSVVFVLDVLTLLGPIWLFGAVKTWEPPKLRTRLEQLMPIYRAATQNPQMSVQPSLLVSNTDHGGIPTDCRLLVKVRDADPGFIGIQAQTSFNDVRGTDYPYTYCVLIAKPEFGLRERAKRVIEVPPPGGFSVGLLGLFADDNDRREAKFARLDEALVELKKEGEVEIAVVRQDTSEGTAGYTTSPEEALEVFSTAVQLARGVLGQG